jgi:hypothetical protein
MTPFRLELDLKESCDLYLSLREDEDRAIKVRDALRNYLYGELSIEEMEKIEVLSSSKLKGHAGNGSRGGGL